MAKGMNTAKGRRPGRPPKPEAERLTDVRSRVPIVLRDEIDRRALRERKSTSAVVRDILAAYFRGQKIQPADPGPTLGA